MSLLLFNLSWMTYNILLGSIAVIAGLFMLQLKQHFSKFLSGIIWLLFIPNTIYILTDHIHIFEQLPNIALLLKPILVLQYFCLILAGITTFIYALYPFEKLLKKYFKKKKEKHTIYSIVIVVNFVIAFGVIIGRIQRTNSWEVFTNTQKVITDSLTTLVSPKLMLIVIVFGILTNLIYFSTKAVLIKPLLKAGIID